MCALLTLPHPEHLFKAVTSFKALPAYCLCRFFMWEVFFFGTARSIDSQISLKMDGMLRIAAKGRTGFCILCRKGMAIGRSGALARGRRPWRSPAGEARRSAIVLSWTVADQRGMSDCNAACGVASPTSPAKLVKL